MPANPACQIRPNGLVSGMRSKEFDPDDVLQEALKTFWQQGFEGTNMPELLGSMGVGRASFYNAFSSKREVFLQTSICISRRCALISKA